MTEQRSRSENIEFNGSFAILRYTERIPFFIQRRESINTYSQVEINVRSSLKHCI